MRHRSFETVTPVNHSATISSRRNFLRAASALGAAAFAGRWSTGALAAATAPIRRTGVRNNFTTADKSVRDAGVQHIKEWIEVAARLGAPVLRVFADTQMKAQTWETASNGATRAQVEEWIAGHVRECAEHGKKFGV